MKKKICSALILAMSLSMTACGAGSTESNTAESSAARESTVDARESTAEATEDVLSFDDLEFEIVEGEVDGIKQMVCNLKNNSEYTLVAFSLGLDEKEDVTEEEEEKLWKEIQEKNSYSDEEMEDLKEDLSPTYMYAYTWSVIKPGDEKKDITFESLEDLDTKELYDLDEPDSATVQYIDENYKICTLDYDFKEKTGTLDYMKEDANQWEETSLTKLVSTPESEIIIGEFGDELSFADVYMFSDDAFKSYVKDSKNKGFTNIDEESKLKFEASNGDGVKLTLDYNPDDEYMTISLQK